MRSEISAIIPVYNDFDTIERALLSVVKQTYSGNIRIIVVNDGSKPEMQDHLNEFIKNNESNNRSFLLLSQENKGVSAARNDGVLNAKSEFIAFLDADDEWHPDKISRQYNIINKRKLNFLASTYTYDEFSKVKSEIKLVRYTFKQMLVRNRFSTPSVMMRRQFFNSLGGFDESLGYIEDYDLWLRVALVNNIYMIYNPPLVRLHKFAYGVSGLSSNMKMMYSSEKIVYKKLFKNKQINIFQYCMASILLRIKFIKRLIIRFLK
jgi:glycosyltransferase involved in cell wall biosynthesis